MAHWKAGFPSRYLSTDECEVPIIATIRRITSEEIGIGDDRRTKPVLHFREGQSKPCIMNVTRCQAVAEIAGSEDTTKWVGVTIRMSKGHTRFQGKKVACIDIDAPPGQTPLPAQAPTPDDDDSVPF